MGFKKCVTYSYKGNSCFVLTNGISIFADHLGLLLRFNRTIVGLRATADRALVVAVASRCDCIGPGGTATDCHGSCCWPFLMLSYNNRPLYYYPAAVAVEGVTALQTTTANPLEPIGSLICSMIQSANKP
jgi:hypothetical protein